jgi:site-specific recombinase XerD
MPPKKLPKVISQQEFEKLFAEAKKIEDKTKSKFHKKNYRQYRVAMLLGFEAGLRISEIVGYGDKVPPLTKSRIEGQRIWVASGKGGKDRPTLKPKRLNEKAMNMLPLKIKRRALQHFVTMLGKKVLKKDISFHTLRHGFGSHLANQGRPLHEIQMLMGHSRMDTTGIYLHANPEKAIKGAQEVF